jgi:hypothetical protein
MLVMARRDGCVAHPEGSCLAWDTPPEIVNQIVQRGFRKVGDGGIVIHSHLVSHSSGIRIIERLLAWYRVAATAYPVFLIWASSIWEVLSSQ